MNDVEMIASGKAGFLDAMLKELTGDFKRKRDRSRGHAGWLKGAMIVIAATTTVLLGTKGYLPDQDYAKAFDIAALALSAIGSMIAAAETLTGSTWRWIRYRKTLCDLYEIQDDFNYQSAAAKNALEDAALDGFYNRIRATLAAYNNDWINERAQTLVSGKAADK